jgi:formamidopyrimidine-DNA glycosylase
MPELPEVETVMRGLMAAMKGRSIKTVTLHRAGLRHPFPKTLSAIKDLKILHLTRRAKYMLLALSNGQSMILHLGMSGRMTILNGDPRAKETHDHMTLLLDDGTRIVFNDPRRFGIVDLAETSNILSHRFFAHLGPEPFDDAFSAAYLAEKCAGKKTSIKIALMDQRIVVGIGNIYAAEALFESGIDPQCAAGDVSKSQLKKLVAAVRGVLQKAIAAGGSSLRDYVQASGDLGYFQHQWAVYGREGAACKGCTCDIQKTGGVRRITQGGRSTFYCPRKQG